MNHTLINPTADGLTGLQKTVEQKRIRLCFRVRHHDYIGWSASTAGFFRFKSVIPNLLQMAADAQQPQMIFD